MSDGAKSYTTSGMERFDDTHGLFPRLYGFRDIILTM